MMREREWGMGLLSERQEWKNRIDGKGGVEVSRWMGMQWKVNMVKGVLCWVVVPPSTHPSDILQSETENKEYPMICNNIKSAIMTRSSIAHWNYFQTSKDHMT